MTKRYAKDYKCCKCGKQAEVFFGMADPDCEQYPYCKECCEKTKMNIYFEISKLNSKEVSK